MLGFAVREAPTAEILRCLPRAGYEERLVQYRSGGASVPAVVLVPEGKRPFPGVVVHHQHNSEWHLGKSEPAGLAGDPLNAFGPALARRGIVALMPDAVGFEDRRSSGPGTALREEEDRLAYMNEMAHRLVSAELLMSTVVADAAAALGVLMAMDEVDAERVGALGHSMGGSTTLFYAALDPRVRFACASGAAATYRARVAAGTGIELGQIIPGILNVADVDAVAALIAPRPLLLVSATEDEYSQDADEVERAASTAYARVNAAGGLRHIRFEGAHALTSERFECIVSWVSSQAEALAA